MAVALYMDVHVHSSVTEQLRRRGIDVLTAQDDDSGDLDDEELLGRSAALGRVMFTFDIRFKARRGLAAPGKGICRLDLGPSDALDDRTNGA